MHTGAKQSAGIMGKNQGIMAQIQLQTEKSTDS
jgi:hypothetical protein